jgi:hypothetical protein
LPRTFRDPPTPHETRPTRSRGELRTRLKSDPRPEHAPRPEDFIVDLGGGRTQALYDDARLLTLEERWWLNRVAPDPDYLKRPAFYRFSNWKPASYLRGTGRTLKDPYVERSFGPPGELISLDELRDEERDELEAAA